MSDIARFADKEYQQQVTNRTLPPLLYYYTVFGNVGPASALALLMMIPAICVVIGLRTMLSGSLLGGGFR